MRIWIIAVTSLVFCELSAAGSLDSTQGEAAENACYSRVSVPAQYRTRSSRVVLSEASERISVVPAKFEWSTEKVLVKEASVGYRVTPATYSTAVEAVQTQAPYSHWVSGSIYSSVEVSPGVLGVAADAGVPVETAVAGQCFAEYFEPPVYRTNQQRMMISEPSETIEIVPPKYEWVERQLRVSTGEFQTVRQRRVVEPAKQIRTPIPARYRDIAITERISEGRHFWHEIVDIAPPEGSRRTGTVICKKESPARIASVSKLKVETPAMATRVEIPAQYASKKVRRIVSNAVETKVYVPAVIQRKDTRVKVADARVEWRQVLCDASDTNPVIRELQKVLNENGYRSGDIDGVLSARTMSALEQYQRANSLAIGAVTTEALQQLGLNYPN